MRYGELFVIYCSSGDPFTTSENSSQAISILVVFLSYLTFCMRGEDISIMYEICHTFIQDHTVSNIVPRVFSFLLCKDRKA